MGQGSEVLRHQAAVKLVRGPMFRNSRSANAGLSMPRRTVHWIPVS